MESTNAERRSQQCTDGTESSESFSLPQSYTSSSSADSSLYLESCSCNEGCTDCDYGHCIQLIRRWMEKKECAREEKLKIKNLFSCPHEKNTKSYRTNEVSKKTVAKSESKLLKDYCPYSSDNCGCSSGCTDCDYGLYTYTTKNKTKLKSKVGKEYVRSSKKSMVSFRPLKASERSRRTAKSFSTSNVMRRKRKRKLSKRKTSKNGYSESSSSCDWKTEDQILKSEKKRSASISREPKPAGTARTRKSFSSEKVSKSEAAKISKRRLSWPICDYSESDSNSNEDRRNNCGNIRRSHRTKSV